MEDYEASRARFRDWVDARRLEIEEVRRVADQSVDMAIDALEQAKSIREQDPPPSHADLELASRLEAFAVQAESGEKDALAAASDALDTLTSQVQETDLRHRTIELIRSVTRDIEKAVAVGLDPDEVPAVREARRIVELIDREVEVLVRRREERRPGGPSSRSGGDNRGTVWSSRLARSPRTIPASCCFLPRPE